MERHRKMDAAGPAERRRALIVVIVLLFCPFGLAAQGTTSESQLNERVQQLFAQQRWDQLAELLAPVHQRSADLNFLYGTALAQLGRWQEAHDAFESGARQRPGDKRFPLELAGVEFKQKQYSNAATYLRRALRLDPHDSYGNDFLGTVYFLEGNLEAALKYWNRVDKPRLAQISTDPVAHLDPTLLDRAFAFAPLSTLKLQELLLTHSRVRGLGVFPTYSFDLLARQDGTFDITFRNWERNGWGHNYKEGLFLLFRGLPFQTINPEFYNLKHEAINFVSMFRWDAEKRRVTAQLSSAFEHNPKFNYQIFTDLRSENWNVQTSFQGPTTLLGSLNLRREAIGANFTSFAGARWHWSAGVEISHRDFRSVIGGPALTPNVLAKGYQLKQAARVDLTLWRSPERRMNLEGGAHSEAGSIWSQPSHTFEKLQGAARFHWLPQAEADDYEMQYQLRAGKTFGDVPFDELFMLGLERDNDLWMHGHIGTRDGRKGSAPLGRNYVLSNWGQDKNIFHRSLFTIKCGPFLDVGKIIDDVPGLGSHKWLWDTGAQVKAQIFGVRVALSYGKDLRSGNNAFYIYVNMLKPGLPHF
jgi:tetratricopeptide (TPR) repeat protein